MATSDEAMFIGEVARRAGLNPKTIRFYEEVGLLPRPARSQSGYRLYRAEALEQLAFVRTAQSLGLTLAQIKGLMECRPRAEPPCDCLGELLKEKIADIDDRMEMLRRARERLEEALLHWDEKCAQPGAAPAATICSCIETAARRGSTAQEV
jgi:DNA-binding transcriptional MerR regulator